MLKRIKYEDYKILRLLFNVTIITANDTEALVIIRKWR